MVWNQWLSDEQNIANKQEADRNAALGMAAFVASYAAVRGAYNGRREEQAYDGPRKNIAESFFDGLGELGLGFLLLVGLLLILANWRIVVPVTLVVGVTVYWLWMLYRAIRPSAPTQLPDRRQ